MTDHTTDYPDIVRFRQAQAGSEESLVRLMRQHDGLVHHIIRRLLQEYFASLYEEGAA